MRLGRRRPSSAIALGVRDRSRPHHLAPSVRRAALLAGAVAAIAVVAVVVWGGAGRPRAELAAPLEVVGRRTPTSLVLQAGRAGLRSYEVRLVDGAGGEHALAAEEIPATSWLGSDVRERRIDLALDASPLGEGEARLVVLASDYAPWSRLRGPVEVLSVPLRVDLTPPTLALRSGQPRVSIGGSGLVVYETSDDAVRSGVAIGADFFAGHAGAIPGSNLRAALFALPHDLAMPVRAKLVAVDGVGNEKEMPLPAIVKPKQFPAEEIALGERFLVEKIPDLLAKNGIAPPADPVEAYLLVNRDLRRKTEERVREITRESSPRPLFDGAFLQQHGTAVGSRFAERRTYRYNGRVIDEQTHLGTDLASVKQDPVSAANAGVVTFVGDLGIYGLAIVIDHGLGLATLYAHLSEAGVQPGQSVARGETIGRTGETGLAGGDHLHFSTMVSGVHVDPVEWWDGKWIRDHVTAELAAAGAPPPTVPPAPSPAIAAAGVAQ